MYHSAISHAFCPAKALANSNHYQYSIAPEDTSLPISYIGNIQHVATADITLSVLEIFILSGLLNSGYLSFCISAHLLLSSGAIEL